MLKITSTCYSIPRNAPTPHRSLGNSSANSNGYSVYHFIHNVDTYLPLLHNFHLKINYPSLTFLDLYVTPGHEAKVSPNWIPGILVTNTGSSQITFFFLITSHVVSMHFNFYSIKKNLTSQLFLNNTSYERSTIFFWSSVNMNIKFQNKILPNTF